MTAMRSGVLVLATMTTGLAVAQSGGGAGARVIEEITVTARKTEESLQDVPISISAFNRLEMERRGFRGLEDIALGTPGLSFEDYGGGFGVPVIRGGSQLRIQDLDATTSVYLDGIYLARQYAIDVGIAALDRIEVVKGPQSALFGRNAFMGAINYVSARPSDELDLHVSGTIGSDERYDILGEISGPIAGELLRGRLLVAHSEFDGTFRNEFPAVDDRSYGRRGTSGNIGGFETRTVGINLDSQLTDALSLELNFYNFRRFEEGPPSVRTEASFGDTNCAFDPNLLGGRNRFFCGEIPQRFTPLPGGAPDGTRYVVDPRAFAMDAKTDFASATARYEINDSWGAVYQFGYSDSEIVAAGSNDRDPVLGSAFFGPVMGVNVTPAGTNKYRSHELRVEYGQGQWSGLMGLFTGKIDDFDLFDFAFAPFRDPEPFNISPTQGLTCPDCPLALALTRAATEVDTRAVFARVGWESADSRWRLGAEARYQDEEKKLDPATLNPASPRFRDNWKTFTPRFTVDYRLTDGQMVYSSLARGAKSGGFNNTVFDESQRAFAPDKNWTFEIGSKNSLLDGRVRLNAAVYYTDWKDLQINSAPIGIPPGVTPPAIVDNTGGANIWGAELNGMWLATDMLSVDYAVSYTKAEYTSKSISSRIGLTGACDGIVCPADGNIGGNQLQRQPEFQLSVGAALEGNLAGDWNWYARGDVNYQSKQFMDELNLAWVPNRTLVNLRFELARGPVTASLWVKNLFDEEYGANGFFIALPAGTSYTTLLGDLRTYGLTLTYRL